MNAQLLQWGNENGVKVHQEVEFKDGGAFARSTISAGTIVVRVPLSACLSFDGVTNADRHCDKYAACVKPLLVEKSKKELSHWFAYLHALPTEFDSHPMYYDDKDMLFLRGTNLFSEVMGRKEKWKFEAERIGCTFDDFRWAFTVLSSRSFPSSLFNEQSSLPMLIPVADALNHSPEAQIEWVCSKEEFSLRLLHTVAAGEEIFNNYGPKSNEERMQLRRFKIH